MAEPGGESGRGVESAETRNSGIRWFRQADVRVPGLTIVAHPDTSRVGELVALGGSRDAAQETGISRLEPSFAAPGDAEGRALGDLHLSRRPLVFANSRSGHELRAGGTSMAVEVDGRRLRGTCPVSTADLDRGLVLMLAERIVLVLGWVDPTPRPSLHGAESAPWIGESLPMQRLDQHLGSLAELEVPVLIRGETGSGKELAAARLHRLSRRDGPFVSVNMAALPPSLAAAELFGNSKGAFTGAERARKGYFVAADGGTLLLDEVAETPEDIQASLLRVLETGDVQPLGESRSRSVDVRLIAATDADLEQAMAEGRFREPLFHRLAGVEVRVPPLRRRRDDFGRLFFHFLRRELRRLDRLHRLGQGADTSEPWLPAPLVAQLARQRWPGNVRQLRNLVRELAISGRDADQVVPGAQVERLLAGVDSQDAANGVAPAPPGSPARHPGPKRVYRRVSTVSSEELAKVWRQQRFSLKATAEALGVSRTSLYALVEKHPDIRKASELGAAEIERALEQGAGDLQDAADLLEVSRDGLRLRLDQLRSRAGS